MEKVQVEITKDIIISEMNRTKEHENEKNPIKKQELYEEWKYWTKLYIEHCL